MYCKINWSLVWQFKCFYDFPLSVLLCSYIIVIWLNWINASTCFSWVHGLFVWCCCCFLFLFSFDFFSMCFCFFVGMFVLCFFLRKGGGGRYLIYESFRTFHVLSLWLFFSSLKRNRENNYIMKSLTSRFSVGTYVVWYSFCCINVYRTFSFIH